MATSLPRLQECHNCMRKRRPCLPDKEYKRCSGCHLVSYCDPQCQEEHWIKVHNKHCKVIAGRKELSYTVHGEDCATCLNHKTETLKMKTDDSIEEQAEAGTPCKSSVPCMADETVVRVTKEYLKQFGIMEKMSMKLKAPVRFVELSGKYLRSKYDEHLAHMWHILQVIRNIYFVQLFSKKKEGELLMTLENYIIFLRAKLWKLYTIYGNCSIIECEMNDGSFVNGPIVNLIKEVNDVIGNMGMIPSKITHNLWWSLFLNHFEALITFDAKHYMQTEFTPSCFEGNAYPKLKKHYEKYKDLPQFKTSWLVMGGSAKIEGLAIDLRVPVPSNASCCICKELITAEFAVIYTECPGSWNQSMKIKYQMAVITSRVQTDGGRSIICSSAQNPSCRESLQTFLTEDCVWKDKEKRDEMSALRSMAKFCDNCLRRSLSCHRCSICKSSQYCSNDCLLEDWKKYHKSVCGKLKEEKDKKMPCSKEQKESLFEIEEYWKVRRQLEHEDLLDIFKSGTAKK